MAESAPSAPQVVGDVQRAGQDRESAPLGEVRSSDAGVSGEAKGRA
jgi:hypothetical protein